MVFDSYPEMKAAIDDESLDVTPDHVLVLRNAGPQGGPGMPEWGMLPMPKALLKQGHRDMLRLSDARMSGTSYGACVLHVAPESHVGGPLALLRTGDIVRSTCPTGASTCWSTSELARRRAAWKQPEPPLRARLRLDVRQHVGQADKGCDFDFLAPDSAAAGEPDIF